MLEAINDYEEDFENQPTDAEIRFDRDESHWEKFHELEDALFKIEAGGLALIDEIENCEPITNDMIVEEETL